MAWKQCLAAVTVLLLGARTSRAQAPELWFDPPDSVAQHSADFHTLFDNPQSWAATAKHTNVFSVTINYVAAAPQAEIARGLAVLQANGIKLDVSVPALPVDKKVCGDGVEGMIWQGESELAIRTMQKKGVQPDYISYDLPLTDGHISKDKRACHFSIKETAERLAKSTRVFRAAFPNVKLIDEEVPTGIPTAEWTATLTEWLADYKVAAGETFNGMTLDMWWEFKWIDTARQSGQILHNHGVRLGTFVDADKGANATPQAWIAEAKTNACNVRKQRVAPDYVVVSNWMRPGLPNGPETNPDSLAALVAWYATGKC